MFLFGVYTEIASTLSEEHIQVNLLLPISCNLHQPTFSLSPSMLHTVVNLKRYREKIFSTSVLSTGIKQITPTF